MLLENAGKQQIAEIKAAIAPKLIKEPLFMFCCSDISKRPDFIDAYLTYYLYEWSRYDKLLYNENSKIVGSLVDPDTFAYKYKGKGARAMKKQKNATTVFVHRGNLQEILDIVVPPTREVRVLNIYASPELDIADINAMIDEAMELAVKEEFILVYESLSRKLVALLESKGFTISSQKQFLNTQYIETVMVYNM